MLLSFLILLMFIMVTMTALTPSENVNKLRVRALEGSLLLFIISLLLLMNLYQEAQFQQVVMYSWDSVFIEFKSSSMVFAVDGVSMFFIMLSTLLVPICILVSWNSIKFLFKEFIMCLFALELLLMVVFSTLDLLVFFILFESVLMPMFLMMGVWGISAEKVKAAYYFFFYTLAGSVLMLLSMAVIWVMAGTTDYLLLINVQMPLNVQLWLFMGFFVSLAIKIPMFPFHMWLPLAHVEAPVAGSILLAGILLKLGGYGLISFALPMFPEAALYLTPAVLVLSIMAVMYGSLTTCSQLDAKRLMAYSSVAHMGMVTMSMFTCTMEGLTAATFLMMGHGLVSPALFMAVTLLYERHGTSLMKYYSGTAMAMPLFSFMFMMFMLANMAVPLSCNFVGEFACLLAMFSTNTSLGVLSSSSVILAAAYSLYLYNSVCFGQASSYLMFSSDISSSEFSGGLTLMLFIMLLGVMPSPLMGAISICVSSLM